MVEKIATLRSRAQLAVLHFVASLRELVAWSKKRRKEAMANESGFVTLEWVLIAGGLVVLAGIVIVIVSGYVRNKAGAITGN